eukprot:6584743-Pyramimonas_sp.AAC.3
MERVYRGHREEGIQRVYRGYTKGIQRVSRGYTEGIERVYRGYTEGIERVYRWHREGIQRVYRGYTEGIERVYRGHTEDIQRAYRGHTRVYRGHTEGIQRAYRGYTEGIQRAVQHLPHLYGRQLLGEFREAHDVAKENRDGGVLLRLHLHEGARKGSGAGGRDGGVLLRLHLPHCAHASPSHCGQLVVGSLQRGASPLHHADARITTPCGCSLRHHADGRARPVVCPDIIVAFARGEEAYTEGGRQSRKAEGHLTFLPSFSWSAMCLGKTSYNSLLSLSFPLYPWGLCLSFTGESNHWLMRSFSMSHAAISACATSAFRSPDLDRQMQERSGSEESNG